MARNRTELAEIVSMITPDSLANAMGLPVYSCSHSEWLQRYKPQYDAIAPRAVRAAVRIAGPVVPIGDGPAGIEWGARAYMRRAVALRDKFGRRAARIVNNG